MSLTGNVFIFLGTVAAISVTGAMMPGPVTAAAIVKGYRQKWAGVLIALGHAVVEFPTIALMALGFSAVLQNPSVSIGIGILGGAMLIFMGVSMILSRGGVVQTLKRLSAPPEGKSDGGKDDKMDKKEKMKEASRVEAGDGEREKGKSGKEDAPAKAADPFPYHPVIAGIITTASNPYYFLWWATLGAALTLNALEFGLVVLVAMAIVHWSIDLGWDAVLAYTVHRSRSLWSDRTYAAVFAFCGGVMVFFGIWFAGSAVAGIIAMI